MPGPEPEDRKDILDSIAELMQLGVDWFRQEAESTMRDKVVLPLQQLGLTLSSAQAAGCALLIGVMFVSVGLFMFLGNAIGYPWACIVVGAVYLIVSGVFLFVKVRSMQK